jgi:hypothetical protein
MLNSSTTKSPHASLTDWAVFEVPSRGEAFGWTRHFVGFDEDHVSVSEPIESFDALDSAGKTSAGKVFQLVGAPAWPSEARRLWAHWKILKNVTLERDITAEFYAGLQMLGEKTVV